MKQTALQSRRRFLATTLPAAAASPLLVSPGILGRAGQTAPNDRIQMGCIGVGPRGTAVMYGFLNQKDARVVAVADVKKWVAEGTRDRVNAHYKDEECRIYGDFRELLERKDIDAVTVATADHWHVLCSIAAARAGKAVYMEKPIGVTMEEAWALRKTFQETGAIFQFGTQQRSDTKFCLASELARNDKMGALNTVRVWSPPSVPGGSDERAEIPEGLDYDFWLGPAPFHPYTVDRCSNDHWWFISTYALGFIAGWGIHPVDIALWGGGDRLLKGKVEVEGSGSFPTEGTHDTATDWDLTLRYSSGVVMEFKGRLPEEWKNRYPGALTHGTAFEGEDGWVHVNRGVVNSAPEELLHTDFGSDDEQLYQSTNHARNLLDCVRSGKPTVCPVEAAVQAETVCQISDIAIRLKRKLIWDLDKEEFVNDAEANGRLRRPMRKPWALA